MQHKDTDKSEETTKSTQCHVVGKEISVKMERGPRDEPFILGPYAVPNNKYRRVWRICPDTHGAFISSVLDTADLGLDTK